MKRIPRFLPVMLVLMALGQALMLVAYQLAGNVALRGAEPSAFPLATIVLGQVFLQGGLLVGIWGGVSTAVMNKQSMEPPARAAWILFAIACLVMSITQTNSAGPVNITG